MITIRKCAGVDVPVIIDIHDALANGTEDAGFFLGPACADAMFSAVSSTGKLFLVAELDRSIGGYLLADTAWVPPDGGVLHPEFSPSIPHIHIQQVASVERGAGAHLYSHLIDEFGGHSLSAFVATHPKRNVRSARFHLKMGFSAVATFSASSFAGIFGYQSTLFAMGERR